MNRKEHSATREESDGGEDQRARGRKSHEASRIGRRRRRSQIHGYGDGGGVSFVPSKGPGRERNPAIDDDGDDDEKRKGKKSKREKR
jgi:hypothetical protein